MTKRQKPIFHAGSRVLKVSKTEHDKIENYGDAPVLPCIRAQSLTLPRYASRRRERRLFAAEHPAYQEGSQNSRSASLHGFAIKTPLSIDVSLLRNSVT